MPEEITPLTPQEMDIAAFDLLNLDTLLERRLVLTVLDRERQHADDLEQAGRNILNINARALKGEKDRDELVRSAASLAPMGILECKERCDELQRQLFDSNKQLWEAIQEIGQLQRQLAEARKDTERLKYYFTGIGKTRSGKFVDLEMRLITGDAVPLEDWISAIDESIDAAREKEH